MEQFTVNGWQLTIGEPHPSIPTVSHVTFSDSDQVGSLSGYARPEAIKAALLTLPAAVAVKKQSQRKQYGWLFYKIEPVEGSGCGHCGSNVILETAFKDLETGEESYWSRSTTDPEAAEELVQDLNTAHMKVVDYVMPLLLEVANSVSEPAEDARRMVERLDLSKATWLALEPAVVAELPDVPQIEAAVTDSIDSTQAPLMEICQKSSLCMFSAGHDGQCEDDLPF